MGNSLIKFDIVSNLPREVVAIVLSHLSRKDVANCTLVSQAWNETVCSLTPYWWTAIERDVGLSREAIARAAPSFSTPKALFVAARKYKAKVASKKLKSSPVELLPPSAAAATDLQFTLCLEASDLTIVRSQKTKKEGLIDNVVNCSKYGLLLEKLSVHQLTNSESDTPGVAVTPVAEYPLLDHSSVAWADVSGDRSCLYWVTRCGLWKGMDVGSQEELFSWKNNLLNNGCGVTYACCKDCSLFVASQWMPLAEDNDGECIDQSSYALQVVSLGGDTPKELVRWKRFQSHHNHPVFLHHDSRYWIRETLITSNNSQQKGNRQGARRKRDGAICHQHTLIVQSDHCTVLHTIQDTTIGSSESTDKVWHESELEISAGRCINCAYGMKYNDESLGKHYTRNVSSGIKMSSDESLVGMVFKHELRVWKLSSNNVANTCRDIGLELVGKTALKTRSEASERTSNSIRLVALGHNLSMIAYHYDTYVMDYHLHVVTTHTGESLMDFRRIERFYDWSLCCQVDPLHKFYFMTLNEEWLNSIQCESNDGIPITPIVTLHNHHGRMHIESIQCYKPKQNWRKQRRCIVQ